MSAVRRILPVDQPGSLDGVVVGVGGRNIGKNSVPIIVDTGEGMVTCTTSRAIARELGHYLLDSARRFHGAAQWQRDDAGAWALKRFVIHTHEELDATPLLDVVQRLRAIPSEISQIRDPLADLLRDRGDGDAPN